MKYDSWWDEFKGSGWFSKTLLIFPYLLGIYAVGMFLAELIWGPL